MAHMHVSLATQTYISHIAHLNESRYSAAEGAERVVPLSDEVCHTHINVIHGTHLNINRVEHTKRSRIAYLNESCHTSLAVLRRGQNESYHYPMSHKSPPPSSEALFPTIDQLQQTKRTPSPRLILKYTSRVTRGAFPKLTVHKRRGELLLRDSTRKTRSPWHIGGFLKQEVREEFRFN